MDVVSQILTARRRNDGGIERMVGASVAAHAALLAVVMLSPGAWFGEQTVQPEAVMTISLGGPPGPRAGGMTTLGGRPIQTETTEAKRAIEPVRPPAAREPDMIEPLKTAPKKAEAKTQTDAKDPRSRTPTKGAEVRQGSSVAETGAKGQGFGLTTGGGGDAGYLDVANFCCPEYLAQMIDRIYSNWQRQGTKGNVTVVKYTIQRDGSLTDPVVERSSGNAALDLFARRAVIVTAKLPPLPAAFDRPTLTVYLNFVH